MNMKTTRSVAWGAVASLLVVAPSCGGADEEEAAAVGDPGPSPLRRLTRLEYNNAVFQIFGDTSQPALASSRAMNSPVPWRSRRAPTTAARRGCSKLKGLARP